MWITLDDHDRDRVDVFLRKFRTMKPAQVVAAVDANTDAGYQRAGKLAEVAVSKALHLSVNWAVHVGSDCGDFTLPGGRTLAVRGVQVLKRMDVSMNLIVRDGEAPADFYVLVRVAPGGGYAVIDGFCSRTQFEREASRQHGWGHRHGNPRVLDARQLRPIEEFQ